jgi:hypothetical protein
MDDINPLVSGSELDEHIDDKDDIDTAIDDENGVTPLLTRTGWREESHLIGRNDRSVYQGSGGAKIPVLRQPAHRSRVLRRQGRAEVRQWQAAVANMKARALTMTHIFSKISRHVFGGPRTSSAENRT